MKQVKGFSLTELLIALMIFVAAVGGIMGTIVFFLNQVKAQVERSDCQVQMNFALEDMKLHFMSAIESTMFVAANDGSFSEWTVEGERDVYNVTPENKTDNEKYTYKIDANAFVRERRRVDTGALLGTEVLVDARFSPEIGFSYKAGSAPNFLTMQLMAKTKRAPLGMSNEIVRTEGVRFWFINIAE